MLPGGGETIVVAVSGGPDSMCLLHVLGRLQAGLTLIVAHVDHGLSDSSEAISTSVAGHASGLGLDVHVARAKGLEGPNMHARARDFRYSFFETIALQEEATCIATGHTLDDRVETTLARLIHGGGTAALAGIPAKEGKRIRPLIDIRRAETRAYCDEIGLPYVDDPANEDPRFDRASIRDLVLAPIEQRWGEGAVRAMATSADRLHEDAQALEALTDRVYAESAQAEEGSVRFELPLMLAMSRSFRRRLLEKAVGRLRDRSGGVDAVLDHLDRHGGPAQGEESFSLPKGGSIKVTASHVEVLPPGDAQPGDH
jgi:tRNA(Ile)-lysidine synthase